MAVLVTAIHETGTLIDTITEVFSRYRALSVDRRNKCGDDETKF